MTELDHDRVRGTTLGGYGEWSMDVEWLLEEAARTWLTFVMQRVSVAVHKAVARGR